MNQVSPKVFPKGQHLRRMDEAGPRTRRSHYASIGT